MGRFRSATALLIAHLASLAGAGESPQAKIDLKRPGVRSEGVVERGLFFASPDKPAGLGPQGVGTFKPGATLTLPISISMAGRYRCALTYALAGRSESISLTISGQAPSGWQKVELWPTVPALPWGGPSLYGYVAGGGGRLDWPTAPWRLHRDKQFVTWVIDGPGVTLRPGMHELKITFHGDGLLLAGVHLLPGNLPQNTAQPWLIDGYPEFPGLDFQSREVQQRGKTLRITLHGQWHNLDPGTVRYGVAASVLPRRGRSSPIFKVVEIEPARTLTLKPGQSAPFKLTVEAAEPVPSHYSEMIRLELVSQDVPNLAKPYLMCATCDYLPVSASGDFRYLHGYGAGRMALREGTNPRDVIPTRQTLGFKAGRYERSLEEAFVKALAEAKPPVVTRSGFNLTEWALAGGDPAKGDFVKERPFATILSALGQGAPADLHKQCLMLLAEEMPFYPAGRWDSAACRILPSNWLEHGGIPALASYVVLLRSQMPDDAAHFRFLHNVVLPTYLCMRDDFRVSGVLARAARAGDNRVQIARATAPHVAATDFLGPWLRIGAGKDAEYVRIARRAGDGTVELALDFPGPLKRDHPAGTPWRSFQVSEWIELEAADLWSYLCVAIASRDAAVVEQCAEVIEMIFATQNVFREDGSFANEPGSYGWAAYAYIEAVAMIDNLIGRQWVPISDELRRRILRALVMWNDFAFSDGTHPMLNGGGARNQLERLPYFGQGTSVLSLKLLKDFAPEQKELIQYYQRIIEQERNRKPGTTVDNRSFKVDGWGYAMLRGPGAWDKRMETLLASKHLNSEPGDHVSSDCLGICLFAHGAIMTPRYGYHWVNDLDFFVNRARIDGKPQEQRRIWGDFLHFDPHREMPSAVAYTDMCGPRSKQPGIARQERWCVQLPEYLFDAYLIRPRDGQPHQYELGFHHLGELSIATPAGAVLRPARNPDGSPWEPFGYYRKNTGKEGQEFSTDGPWQADWTLNEGSIMFGPVAGGKTFGPDTPYPPRGARLRLSMAPAPSTRVVIAWLTAPGRNEMAELRQDFLVVQRRGNSAAFISTIEPVGVGQEPLVQRVEVVASVFDKLYAVRVTTRHGDDWFLVGSDFSPQATARFVGPMETDGSLAVVRVRGGRVVRGMLAGGRSLKFPQQAGTFVYQSGSAGTYHFDGQGADVPGAPPQFDLSLPGTAASADSGSVRVWTDSTGRFRVEAEMVSCEDGVVKLRKPDGQVISVPIARLSDADQDWIRRRAPVTRSAEP